MIGYAFLFFAMSNSLLVEFVWFSAGVPECNHFDKAILNAINNLAKAADNNAAVLGGKVGKERLGRPKIGIVCKKLVDVLNRLHELIH